MESVSKKYPIGTGGGQGPMKKKTAEQLGDQVGVDEITPLPYKTSPEYNKARHGKNA